MQGALIFLRTLRQAILLLCLVFSLFVHYTGFKRAVPAEKCFTFCITLLELNLVRDVKSNKKGFCRYICSERKTRENAAAELGRASGDEGYGKHQGTQCLLHSYW